MRVKYRIQVGDQFCEVDSDWRLATTISDLVNGRSKLQKGAVRPEDIHITVHEAAHLPEAEQGQRDQSRCTANSSACSGMSTKRSRMP